MSNLELIKLSEFMKCFSNPLRLHIMLILQKAEKSVNEVVEDTGAKQCYVSQQLNYLFLKHLLDRRADGHNVYYTLKSKSLAQLLDFINFEFSPYKNLAGIQGGELV